MKNFQYVCWQSGQIRVGYNLNIDKFCHTKNITVQNQIWENHFMGLTFFPRSSIRSTAFCHYLTRRSNWAENNTFRGNAISDVFWGWWSKTTNWMFKGSAHGNKSPLDYFWVWHDFWAIPGRWSGKKAQKWPILNVHFSLTAKAAISLWKTFKTLFENPAKKGWVIIWILVTFFTQN